ncbi:MAG: hypothetical protein M5E90_03395, partial [Asgard group archaeon]|nr:hypothetical protein [Asgard group archaeon]
QQQQQQIREGDDFNNSENLHSRYIENEIIKTFNSKSDLVQFVRKELTVSERSKIVINSSKPKAIYFQCERSGSFRTTVKDPEKRQRVAYTKRNKCGYRLVANLYSNEKDTKRKGSKTDEVDINDPSGSETQIMWVLRMINPQHNHPPDPMNKKRRQKISRTLVETPKNKISRTQDDEVHHSHHHHHHHHEQLQIHAGAGYGDLTSHEHYQQQQQTQGTTHRVDDDEEEDEDEGPPLDQPDAAVIAAIEASTGVGSHESSNVAAAAAAAVAAAAALQGTNNGNEPIDANVDPSVQAHDHAHGLRGRFL